MQQNKIGPSSLAIITCIRALVPEKTTAAAAAAAEVGVAEGRIWPGA